MTQIILAVFNILNAIFDSQRIKKNKRIYHGVNGLLYLVAIAVEIVVFKMNLTQGIVFTISAFFNRQLFFDIPLNLLRGLKWDYVTPERPPKAIWDRVEIRIWGYNGKAPVLIYSVLWIASLMFYYLL